MKYGLSIAFVPPAEYCPLAEAAEERGFSWVSVSDHLIYPKQFSVPYPYTPDGVPRFGPTDPFPDPWITVTAMAQHTTTLKFYTNVFILPARNAIHAAKALSTAACLSEGRIAMGVGMGWMPEEFEAAGQPFKRRGKHADEALAVIQKLWTGDWIEHQGEFYSLPPMRMCPPPPKPIPIFIGGVSEPAMRRAAHYDGWISDLHTAGDLKTLLSKVFDYRRAAGKSLDGYQVMCFHPVDAHTRESHADLQSAGVTTITTMPWALQAMEGPVSLADKIKSLDGFARDFIV